MGREDKTTAVPDPSEDFLLGKAEEALPAEDLDAGFGPIGNFSDLLESSTPVSPMVPAPSLDATASLEKRFRFFGFIILGIFAVQSAYLLFARGDPAPSITAPASPSMENDEVLQAARLKVQRGNYADVVAQLEELAPSLESDHRFLLYSTLSLAYRRLNDIHRANEYSALATEQFVEHQSASGLLQQAESLHSQRQFEQSRRFSSRILLRADGLSEQDQPLLILAGIRLADSYLADARRQGDLEGLPGLPADSPREWREAP